MPLRNRLAVMAFAATAVSAVAATAPTARADHQPAIVVPGRPDVPVIIDGVDARGAVVVGDWGLYRPGFAPILEPGPLLIGRAPLRHGYYPATGRQPRYGRLEIEPDAGRRRPASAQGFYRAWSSDWPRPSRVKSERE
jgi:hypothetical protein